MGRCKPPERAPAAAESTRMLCHEVHTRSIPSAGARTASRPRSEKFTAPGRGRPLTTGRSPPACGSNRVCTCHDCDHALGVDPVAARGAKQPRCRGLDRRCRTLPLPDKLGHTPSCANVPALFVKESCGFETGRRARCLSAGRRHPILPPPSSPTRSSATWRLGGGMRSSAEIAFSVCGPRRVSNEMPVRQRSQVCVSRSEPDRVWLLHAFTGHAGVTAASRRDRQPAVVPESPLRRLQLPSRRLAQSLLPREIRAMRFDVESVTGMRASGEEQSPGQLQPKTCSRHRAVLPLRRGGAVRRPPGRVGEFRPSGKRRELPRRRLLGCESDSGACLLKGEHMRCPASIQ
jgi:hypothetical protein